MAVVDFGAVVVHKDVVDPDAAAAEHVVNPPVAALVAAQDGVRARNLAQRDADVGIRRAADDDLPVLHGEAVPAVAQVGPGLGVVLLAQHRPQAAQQNGHGKQEQYALAAGQRISEEIALHGSTPFRKMQ